MTIHNDTTIKWNGKLSTERNLNVGSPEGAIFGIWEYTHFLAA